MSDESYKRLIEEGIQLQESGDEDAALVRFLEASRLERPYSAAFVNAGLIHKRRRDWTKMRECFLLAQDRSEGLVEWKRMSILWNLGLAATALKDWTTARWAWNMIGLPVDVSDEEPRLPFGPALVETPDCKRMCIRPIDPCRGEVVEVAETESELEFGDVVLHDVSPFDHAECDGEKLPVFELLDIDHPEGRKTFCVELIVSSDEDCLRLENMLTEIGAASNVRKALPDVGGKRQCRAVAWDEEQLRTRLASWESEAAERRVIAIWPEP